MATAHGYIPPEETGLKKVNYGPAPSLFSFSAHHTFFPLQLSYNLHLQCIACFTSRLLPTAPPDGSILVQSPPLYPPHHPHLAPLLYPRNSTPPLWTRFRKSMGTTGNVLDRSNSGLYKVQSRRGRVFKRRETLRLRDESPVDFGYVFHGSCWYCLDDSRCKVLLVNEFGLTRALSHFARPGLSISNRHRGQETSRLHPVYRLVLLARRQLSFGPWEPR